MKIKALVPFSTGTISMEQYEVKEVTETIGEQLVAAGVAVEIGGGSGGVLVVHDVGGTLDKTWQEIHDAFVSGGVVIDAGTYQNAVIGVENAKSGCIVIVANGENWSPEPYIANSTDGYPTTV